MACNRPDGNCTGASPCGCTGGGGATPVVPLPRCNNALPDGVYPRATVVVEDGCIASIVAGEPEVYTPDECCDGGGAGGGGDQGPRGFPGPSGQAATVEVDPAIAQTGSAWSVVNQGTSSHAVLKFTAPIPPGQAPMPPTNFNGPLYGFTFVDGYVSSNNMSYVTRHITASKIANGTASGLFDVFVQEDGSAPGVNTGATNLMFNLDPLYNEFDSRLDTVESTLSGDIGSTNGSVTALHEWGTDLIAYLQLLQAAHVALAAKFDALAAHYRGHSNHPPGTAMPSPYPDPGGSTAPDLGDGIPPMPW